jgi:hypothetical protein
LKDLHDAEQKRKHRESMQKANEERRLANIANGGKTLREPK